METVEVVQEGPEQKDVKESHKEDMQQMDVAAHAKMAAEAAARAAAEGKIDPSQGAVIGAAYQGQSMTKKVTGMKKVTD